MAAAKRGMSNVKFAGIFLGSVVRNWRILIFVTAILVALRPISVDAQSVTLAWNPSTSTNATGYLLYESSDGTNFDNGTDAGSNTTWTVTGLAPGASYYFEVAAYDTNGDTSPPSNEIEYTVPLPQWTMSLQASPTSAGSVAGGGTYTQGTSVTAMATANTGNAFVNWTANGVVQSVSSNYSFTLLSNVTLVANFVTNPVVYTVAASSSPVAGGTVFGAGNFADGSSVTLTATPNAGYSFSSWTQGGVVQSTSASYNFTLSSNRTLVANFSLNNYTVAGSSSPVAGGSVSGGGTFGYGSSVTLTATPNTGYTFSNWTQGGVAQSTSPSYNFTLTGNRTLVANFTPNNYTVAGSSSPTAGGSVSGAGTFAYGSSVTVTATPNTGYTFVNWTQSGIVQSASASYSFTLSSNRTLVANFSSNVVSYTVATSSSPSSGGTVAGGGTFAAGNTLTVTATPNNSYVFTNWTENGIVQSASASYAFTLATNRNLVANFVYTPTTFVVSTASSPASGGTVSGGGTFKSGVTVSLLATPNSGYTFTNWTANGVVQSASVKYSFTLATNVSLVANFVANNTSNVTNTLAISNASFESPTGAQGSVAYVASGWTAANSNPCGVFNPEVGIYANDVNDILPAPADASQVLWIDGSNSVSQTLSATLSANQTYTLTGAIGNRRDGYGLLSGDQAYVYLLAGGVVIAQTNNLPHPSAGHFESWSINYTSPATGVPSGPLEIQLGLNGQGEVNFDNLSLTSTTASNGGSANVNTNNNPPVIIATGAATNFSLAVTGNGTVADGNVAAKLQSGIVEVGTKYTLTAHAGKGSVFAGWISNGVAVATSSKYSFLGQTNLSLQASFVTNPFVPIVGYYQGLFYIPNDPSVESSGALVASVTSAGAYTAKLNLAGHNYSFAGQLTVDGAATNTVKRPGGLSPLTVQFSVDLTNGPLTGTVSDGDWTADLVAEANGYSKANPAPQAGKYTLVIPGSEDAWYAPGGNGFGALTVSATGVVTFSGTLGDGTVVNTTSIIGSDGQCPFYASLYNGGGSILGWLSLTNAGSIEGQTAWFKLPNPKSQYYSAGFTNTSQPVGSSFQYTNGQPVLGFTAGDLVLTNGDLVTAITNQITLGPTEATGTADGSSQTTTKLTIKTSSGLFSGTVLNPATGKPIKVSGAVLQNMNLGAGLFLGANESGSVLLEAQPQ